MYRKHQREYCAVLNRFIVCDPTIRQLGFDLSRQQRSLPNRFAQNRDTAVPVEGKGDLQTLICVLVARPKRFPTLSEKAITSPDWTGGKVYYQSGNV